MGQWVNTLRSRQNGRRFPDDIFKSIFLNENVWISLKISLKFVPKVRINNIPALVQIMAWRRPGNKPLFALMMGNSLTHICLTRPQWVKSQGQQMQSPEIYGALKEFCLAKPDSVASQYMLIRQTCGAVCLPEQQPQGIVATIFVGFSIFCLQILILQCKNL